MYLQDWIQNYTQNHECMTYTYLFALCDLSGHTPDESMDARLGVLLPDLDQGISWLQDSLWCNMKDTNGMISVINDW